jgi:uncharacterized protein
MFFELISTNLISPPILFFILGIGAGFIKSDLNIPTSISRYLAIYLMMSIGFKGGVVIANEPYFSFSIFSLLLAGVLASFAMPFVAYFLLQKTTRLDKVTSAAVAAHYGSISLVTFVTATSFLKKLQIDYDGYIVAVLALMEAPAILSGLYIAHRAAPKTLEHGKKVNSKLAREIFTNGAILLLFGSFIIGLITGQNGYDQLEGFLITPFYGILTLFLLDMGIVVSKQMHDVPKLEFKVLLFAIYMPLIGGSLGVMISYLLSLSIGTGLLFSVLLASASYIAVPAAMRLALPEAKTAIYLPLSLAITFPFNIIIGIPLYHAICEKLLG